MTGQGLTQSDGSYGNASDTTSKANRSEVLTYENTNTNKSFEYSDILLKNHLINLPSRTWMGTSAATGLDTKVESKKTSLSVLFSLSTILKWGVMRNVVVHDRSPVYVAIFFCRTNIFLGAVAKSVSEAWSKWGDKQVTLGICEFSYKENCAKCDTSNE